MIKLIKSHGKDLSTNDFTDGYKKKIDSMQTLYRFKGAIENIEDLSIIENRNIGDTYKCIENSNNYIWNGQEWINIGNDTNYSELLEEINEYETKIEQIKINQDNINQDIHNIDNTVEEFENRLKEVEEKEVDLSNYYNKIEVNEMLDNFEALPVGGTTGQVLAKASNEDNDVEWVNQNVGEEERLGIKIEILKLVFPIGATYITQEDTNPSTILNFGTWERIKGKVCLGLDEEDENLNTIGNIGGEKTHKITTSEIPYKMDAQRNSDTGTNWNNQGITANENNNEMSIMQPYEIVGYMWIRRT